MPCTSSDAPLVSVALPVCNGGKDLRLAVQSIVDQTFADWELLLIDDCSTDDAVSTLESPLDPRVRIISHIENRGLAWSLNEAIDLARGRFFARMDQDDFAHPARLQRQLAFLDNNPAVDLLGTRCVYIDESDAVVGEMVRAITHEEICRQPWRGFHLAHPTWMGRIGWFRRHRYSQPSGYRCEDQQLLLSAYSQCRYHALPEPLLAYRIHAHVPFAKLLKTRLALYGVQTRHFMETKEPGKLMLASLSLLTRIGLDALLMGSSPVRAHAHHTASTLTSAQVAEWHDLIFAARRKVEAAAD